jgi:predicted nuclease of predicted toxin-antitoxin system
MILVDHCVPRIFHRFVKEWGYPATLLHEHISPNSPDPDVLAITQQLDAVLLTADMDFSNILRYPPRDYKGIIVIRYQAQDEGKSLITLKQVLQDLYRDQLRGVMVTITAGRYRIREGL